VLDAAGPELGLVPVAGRRVDQGVVRLADQLGDLVDHGLHLGGAGRPSTRYSRSRSTAADRTASGGAS
jgi:hypothetical protein